MIGYSGNDDPFFEQQRQWDENACVLHLPAHLLSHANAITEQVEEAGWQVWGIEYGAQMQAFDRWQSWHRDEKQILGIVTEYVDVYVEAGNE